MRARKIVLAAACALLLAPGATLASDCKPEYTAMGSMAGPSQSDAERVARARWRAEVNRQYGSAYSDWDKAEGRKIECQKLNADTYQCWATAKPCAK